MSRTSRKILLLGKTGSGKSALGNLLTGQHSFDIGAGMLASAIPDCRRGVSADGQWTVVDTPDVTGMIGNLTAVQSLLANACQLSDEGQFDALLLVTRLDVRFTEEERQVMETLLQAIGSEFDGCCIVVFTHGDCVANSDSKFSEAIASIRRQVPFMDQLIRRCDDRLALMDLSRGCPAEVSARQRENLCRLIRSVGSSGPFSLKSGPKSGTGGADSHGRKRARQPSKDDRTRMNNLAASNRSQKSKGERKGKSRLSCISSKTKD